MNLARNRILRLETPDAPSSGRNFEQTASIETRPRPAFVLSSSVEASLDTSNVEILPSTLDNGTAPLSSEELRVAHEDIAQSPVASNWVRRRTQHLLAEWQGCVLEVCDHYFLAELKGIYGQGVSGTTDEAELPLEDVQDGDRSLLVPGAFFRLCVLYERTPSGPIQRSTQVVFRRLPAYTRHEIDQARDRATNLFLGINID